MRLVTFCGSIRSGSYNRLLLAQAIEVLRPQAELDHAELRDVPLPIYDGDLEASTGVPEPARRLADRIAAADGLVIASPEYNNSIPGTFKNTIDWTSRPSSDTARVYGGKPVGVIGATPGAGGTGLAQAAWLPVLRTLGTIPFFGARLQVAHASKVFDASGALNDEAVRGQIERYLTAFSAFVARLAG